MANSRFPTPGPRLLQFLPAGVSSIQLGLGACHGAICGDDLIGALAEKGRIIHGPGQLGHARFQRFDARRQLLKFIEGHKLPMTVGIEAVGKRSARQNRLNRQWMLDIARNVKAAAHDQWRCTAALAWSVEPDMAPHPQETQALYVARLLLDFEWRVGARSEKPQPMLPQRTWAMFEPKHAPAASVDGATSIGSVL